MCEAALGVGGYLPLCPTVLESPMRCCVPLLALRDLLCRAPSSSLLSSELEPPVPVSVPVGGLAAGSPGQETFSPRHCCPWGRFRLSLKEAEAMHSAAALSQAHRSFSHELCPMPERELSQLMFESCLTYFMYNLPWIDELLKIKFANLPWILASKVTINYLNKSLTPKCWAVEGSTGFSWICESKYTNAWLLSTIIKCLNVIFSAWPGHIHSSVITFVSTRKKFKFVDANFL